MAKKEKQEITLDSLMAKYGNVQEVEGCSSSIPDLDRIYGGKIHFGFMYSLWAVGGGGKTTISCQIIKSFCKSGFKCAFIDSEKALNQLMIDSFGLQEYIDSGMLYHFKSVDNYEQVEEIIIALSKSDVKLVIWDSESAVQPVTKEEMKVTDVRPGIKSAQSSFILNKMKGMFFKQGIASIIIFHARANINIKGKGTVSDEKQAGGYAAIHIPDIITQIRTSSRVTERDEEGEDVQIGVEIVIQTTKNKFCAPFQPIRKKLIFGKGISKRIDLIDTALDRGLISQSGSFFTLPTGEKIKGKKTLYDLPNNVMKSIQDLIANQ